MQYRRVLRYEQRGVQVLKILCWFGSHNWRHRHEWMPSFDAPIVTQYSLTSTCIRCGKVTRSVWNKFDLVDPCVTNKTRKV